MSGQDVSRETERSWYSWYPHRFRKKTLHLSLAADGAYRRLIDEYMIERTPLPDDDIALARILGVPLETWLEVASAVRSYFHVNGSKLVHGTCEEQLNAQRMRRASRIKGAKHASQARWAEHNKNKELEAARMRDACAPNAEAMRTNATVERYITSSEYDAARESNPTTAPGAEPPSGYQGRTKEETFADLERRRQLRPRYT